MSRLLDIKAAQIRAAADAGEDNPYDSTIVIAVDNRNRHRFAEIRDRQLAEAEKTGINPYQLSEAPSASAAPVGDLTHYQASLSADLARLAPVKDIVERATIKAGLIPTYWPFVKAYLDNGDNYPNDVATRICIWLFDTLNIESGLALAFVLIKQNQVTPPKFDRDLSAFVCDAVYDWANALLKQDQSASPYLDELVRVIDDDQWSLAPPVHSKVYAMLAKHKTRTGDYAACLALCEKAEAVNPDGAGVKGLKDKAQKQLAVANGSSSPAEQPPSQ